MACGVLDKVGQWATPKRKPTFLFPVLALSNVFRGMFMAALANAHENSSIEREPEGRDSAWCQRHKELYKHSWVAALAQISHLGAMSKLELVSLFAAIAAGDVWGVGVRIGAQVVDAGVKTALYLDRLVPMTVRRRLSVVLEKNGSRAPGR